MNPHSGNLGEPNLRLDTLKLLSQKLGASALIAQSELKRSQQQLDTLLYSKSLVDESINALSSQNGLNYQTAAQTTLYPTGSLAIPFSDTFGITPPGSGRSLICSQIETSLYSGVAAFIAAVPPEQQEPLGALRLKLNTHNEALTGFEDKLAGRLAKYSPHLESILRGALNSYRDAGNELRFTNTGNALRELLREFLAEVAPDTKVKTAPWFVPHPKAESGVTRRHRIDYAIFRNVTADKFPKEFATQANEIAAGLVADIGQLSELTHVTEHVLGKTTTDAAPLFAAVMQRFLLLISAIETSRVLVEHEIADEITPHLDDLFVTDFFDDLDCLSSHTRVEGASGVEVTDVSFDEQWIRFKGAGFVDCNLQYGSDGDVSRGDGLEWSDSYPFTFSGRVPISDLSAIEINRNSIEIDTSSDDDHEEDEMQS